MATLFPISLKTENTAGMYEIGHKKNTPCDETECSKRIMQAQLVSALTSSEASLTVSTGSS